MVFFFCTGRNIGRGEFVNVMIGIQFIFLMIGVDFARDRRVALKFLDLDILEDRKDQYLERVEREIVILTNINQSQKIAQLYDHSIQVGITL